MWRLLDVAGQKFMAYCTCAAGQFQFVLYDGVDNDGFSETISQAAVIERSAQLNRRIKYPEDVVCQTLTHDQPVQAILDRQADGKIIFKLKYRVKNLPMHCEWHIERMQPAALWESILVPLMQTVKGLTQQVDELRDCVQRKDIELTQYKIEGAVLRRSTVATTEFDFDRFDKLHQATTTQAKGYQNIADYLMQRAASGQTCTVAAAAAVVEATNVNLKIEQENDRAKLQNVTKKQSPRNRKRKALEIGTKHLERKVMQRRQAQQLEYLDSQSQGESQELMPPLSKVIKKSCTSTSTTINNNNDTHFNVLATTNIKTETQCKQEDAETQFDRLVYETSSDEEVSTTSKATLTKNKTKNSLAYYKEKFPLRPEEKSPENVFVNTIFGLITPKQKTMRCRVNISKKLNILSSSDSDNDKYDKMIKKDLDSAFVPIKPKEKVVKPNSTITAAADVFDYDEEMLQIRKTLEELEKIKSKMKE